MQNLKLIGCALIALLGGCTTFYFGIGSLFILGDANAKYRPMGAAFVGIALVGMVLCGIGVVLAGRLSSGGGPRR